MGPNKVLNGPQMVEVGVGGDERFQGVLRYRFGEPVREARGLPLAAAVHEDRAALRVGQQDSLPRAYVEHLDAEMLGFETASTRAARRGFLIQAGTYPVELLQSAPLGGGGLGRMIYVTWPTWNPKPSIPQVTSPQRYGV